MLAGPIFRWEIVSAGRRGRYFLIRVVYALAILLAVWSVYESSYRWRWNGPSSIQQAAAAATGFFGVYSRIQLYAILGIVPVLAVGTISTERERRTIEYLFATDLSNSEIVLGKIGSRLLLAGKFMLVGLPILLLLRLLGGIPLELVLTSTALSASVATLLTALATCVSVWSKRSRDATIRVYLLLAVLLTLVPLLAGWWTWFAGSSPWAWLGTPLQWIAELNPAIALEQSLSLMGSGSNPQMLYSYCGWYLAIAAALTLLAIGAVRRVHLREVGGGVVKKAAERRRIVPRWRPAIGDRPMIWKESFAGTAKVRLGILGTFASAVIGITVLGFMIFAFAKAHSDLDSFFGDDVTNPYPVSREQALENYSVYLMALSGWLGSALVLMAGARGAGLVTIEKERDTWISLLSTPLSGREIVLGKLVGNLYGLRGGFALIVLATLLGGVLDSLFLVVGAASALALTLTATFASLVGIAYSLRSSTTLRATGYALATVLFVGGGYLFCCCVLLSTGGGGDGFEVVFGACIPFLIAFPFAAPDQLGMGVGSSEGSVYAAYVMGIVGYIGANTVLYALTVGGFERLAGRVAGPPASRSSSRPADGRSAT